MKVTSADPTIPGRSDIGDARRLEPDSALVDRVLVRASDGPPMSGPTWNGGTRRRLTPRHQPGRITRKARAYASEIRRLHEAGYTLDAIREALADVGVKVSTSTVWRETKRLNNEASSAPAVDVRRS